MKHLDLFSGIGGAALAVDMVWPGSEHTFVEIDKYCQALLKLRFPNSQIHGDIRTFGLDTYSDGDGFPKREAAIDATEGGEQALDGVAGRDRTLTADARESVRFSNEKSRVLQKSAREKTDRFIGKDSIDILTGGFPCQPFSQAGRRKGTADNRHLWPEMLRVIREFKPQWVIGENVGGFVTWSDGLVLRQVFADLESEGYEVQAFIIPACAVNAPHRRDRVWIVAHTEGGYGAGKFRNISGENETKSQPKEQQQDNSSAFSNADSDASNANYTGRERKDLLQQRRPSNRRSSGGRGETRWNENWLEVATELCGVDDGLPAELDGLKLSKSRHRAERLKGLGNAWVPAVAIEIMKKIKEID